MDFDNHQYFVSLFFVLNSERNGYQPTKRKAFFDRFIAYRISQ